MTHPIQDGVGEPILRLGTRPVAFRKEGILTVGTIPAADRNLSRDFNFYLETGPSQGTRIFWGVLDIGGTVVPPKQENLAFRGTDIPRKSQDFTPFVFLRIGRREFPLIPDPSQDPSPEPQEYAFENIVDYDSAANRYLARWTGYDPSQDTMEPAEYISYSMLVC